MNNKGFTLIELIGSIIILTIIALVVFPAVLNIMTSSQGKIDNAKKNLIERAAKEYVEDNVNNYPRTTELSENITVEELINKGYIKEKTIDVDKDTAIYHGCVNVSVEQKTIDEEEFTSYKFEFKTEC